MDSSLSLLKEEINKTNEQLHDLAKWKLGVAAFGITKDSKPNHWLLLLVPFVCAYIDLYAYQYQVRIMALAHFLRHQPAGHDQVLGEYELACDKWRGGGAFSLGTMAELGSSFGTSLAGPIFYLLVVRQDKTQPSTLLVTPATAVVIWLLGLLLIVVLWQYFRSKKKKFEG